MAPVLRIKGASAPGLHRGNQNEFPGVGISCIEVAVIDAQGNCVQEESYLSPLRCVVFVKGQGFDDPTGRVTIEDTGISVVVSTTSKLKETVSNTSVYTSFDLGRILLVDVFVDGTPKRFPTEPLADDGSRITVKVNF